MAINNDIQNNINVQGLDDLEIARLLYIELCKRVSFSTKFQNTDDISMVKMLRAEVDGNTFSKEQVNCVMWSQLYSQLLTKYGVEHEIINSGHQFIEFYARGQKWVADATYGTYTDMARVHQHDSLKGFGLSIYQTGDKHYNVPRLDSATLDQLKEVDEKIGYEVSKELTEFKKILGDIREGKRSIDEFFPNNSGNSIDKKIQLISAKVGQLTGGYYESKDFIRFLFQLVMTSTELNNVKGTEIKRTRPDGEVDIVQVLSVNDDANYTYYALCNDLPIREMSQKNIIELSILGYAKEKNKEIPGMIFPKNFVPGLRPKRVSYNIDKMIRKFTIKDQSLLQYEQSGAPSR